mgnify:CR=1 FL=1
MINFKTIIRIIGILLLLETVMFLVCSGVSFYYRESDMLDFWKAGGITAGVGLLLAALGKGGERQLTRRDGYVLVSFAWVAFSLFGMLPFYIGGYIPDIANAFFETMSGFSSTGATILDDIESLPHGILLLAQYDTVDWRLGNHHVHHCSASHLRSQWPAGVRRRGKRPYT